MGRVHAVVKPAPGWSSWDGVDISHVDWTAPVRGITAVLRDCFEMAFPYEEADERDLWAERVCERFMQPEAP